MVMPFTELGETEREATLRRDQEFCSGHTCAKPRRRNEGATEPVSLPFWECFRIGSQWGREGLRWGDWGSEGKSEDACSYW